MLPFVFVDASRLHGVQPFAIFVVAAIWLGHPALAWRVRTVGLDVKAFGRLFTWCLALGFVFGHVLDELFYDPSEIAAHPWTLLMLWRSLSSFGGFVGVVVAAFVWSYTTPRQSGASRPFILPYADAILSVFPLIWALARVGCAVVHDHPGALVAMGSPLAVAWPTGPDDGVERLFLGGLVHVQWGSTARYDLGLLEALFSLVLGLAFAATWHRRLTTGTYVAATALAYSPVRFAMDWLRAHDEPGTDLRHAGLTFAQWCCVAFFAFGIGVVATRKAAHAT